jgi:hypothetical protein
LRGRTAHRRRRLFRSIGVRKRAKHFIGNGEGGTHFRDVVNAHHMRSAQHRRSNGSGCREAGFRLVRLRQEGLSRRPDEDRIFQLGEIAEARQDLRILLFAFAEADAGIENDGEPFHARTARAADGGVEILRDREHDIRYGA